MNEISIEHKGNYGYRHITIELRKRGFIVNHKKVLRIMRLLGITCMKFTRKSIKFSSYRRKIGKVAKNTVNRRFITPYPLQKIATDTTEFKYYTRGKDNQVVLKKAYLAPYLDMFNGEILSYRLSKQPNAKAVLEGLDEVIDKLKHARYRTTIHTDQNENIQSHSLVTKYISTVQSYHFCFISSLLASLSYGRKL